MATTTYQFPFHTCEKPNKDGIAQPYSALVNVVTCTVILYFLVKTKTTHAFLFLLAILLFEAFHTFSHIVHIPGTIQVSIAHTLAYVSNFAFLRYGYQVSRRLPSRWFASWYTAWVLMDIYAFRYMTIVVYILTQTILFLSTMAYYYKDFPRVLRENIPWIFGFSAVTVVLVFNESKHCNIMLAWYPHFPYHMFIELSGLVLFYFVSSSLGRE